MFDIGFNRNHSSCLRVSAYLLEVRFLRTYTTSHTWKMFPVKNLRLSFTLLWLPVFVHTKINQLTDTVFPRKHLFENKAIPKS